MTKHCDEHRRDAVDRCAIRSIRLPRVSRQDRRIWGRHHECGAVSGAARFDITIPKQWSGRAPVCRAGPVLGRIRWSVTKKPLLRMFRWDAQHLSAIPLSAGSVLMLIGSVGLSVSARS